MKILLINKFHYLRGGAERVYLQEKELLESKGHEVQCFSMEDLRNEPCEQDIFFVPNTDFSEHSGWLGKSFRYIYYPEAARRLESLLREFSPDVAHLHNIHHYLSPSILKPLNKRKIPVIQTLHDYQIICPNYSLYTENAVCERCKKRKYYNCILNKCVQDSYLASILAAKELYLQWFFGYYRRKIDLFISPSKFLARKIQDWGVKQPVEVITNALDLRNFVPRYEAGKDIVFIGRLIGHKGILTLLKAMRANPELPLKIVGKGPLATEAKRLARKYKLQNTEFLGAKYGKDLQKIISKARFTVFPSESYENYPMVILESYAMGKPVLSSKLGGAKELVAPDKTGRFFQAGNEQDLAKRIKEMYDLPSGELERMGRAARAQIEKDNDFETYYKKLMRIFSRLTGESGMG